MCVRYCLLLAQTSQLSFLVCQPLSVTRYRASLNINVVEHLVEINFFIIFPTQKHERVPSLIQTNNVWAVSVAYKANPRKSPAKAADYFEFGLKTRLD